MYGRNARDGRFFGTFISGLSLLLGEGLQVLTSKVASPLDQ